MARSSKTGALIGRAARNEKADRLSAMLDEVPLSEIEQIEIKLNVARKMHHSMKINKGLPGFKFTRKFYHRARRLEKKLAELQLSFCEKDAPTNFVISGGEVLEISAVRNPNQEIPF